MKDDFTQWRVCLIYIFLLLKLIMTPRECMALLQRDELRDISLADTTVDFTLKLPRGFEEAEDEPVAGPSNVSHG